MLLLCFCNITPLLLPECDFHSLQSKQQLPLLYCSLRLFTGSTRCRVKCWYCNVFACFGCRRCDVKPSSRWTSLGSIAAHSDVMINITDWRIEKNKNVSFLLLLFYFLWRNWGNVSCSGQTDHCSIYLFFSSASERNKVAPRRTTEWTAQTGGAVMSSSQLTMHPPATNSNTQLVKMKYLYESQLLLQPIEHLQEISAQVSEETRPLVKTHTVHYCVCVFLLTRDGKRCLFFSRCNNSFQAETQRWFWNFLVP